MNMLLRGMESAKRVSLLLSLTKINSDDIIKSLNSYLVDGRTESGAVAITGVEQQNFNRALKKLNETASIVEQIKELDWERFNNQLSDVNFKKDST